VLAYLCRFAVRAPAFSLEAFLGSVGSATSVLNFPRRRVSRFACGGFAYRTLYPLAPGRPTPGCAYPPASPHRPNERAAVREYEPVLHRLRLPASPSVPTNPERTSLPQESLGLRRRGFSPRLSLLIPAFSLPCAPRRLPVPLQRCTERSPTIRHPPDPQ